jgi:hypothetical protein
LDRPELKELWDVEKTSSYSEDLRQKLKKMKSPALFATEERFYHFLQENRPPSSVAITPSPAFEKEEITVQFHFKDIQSYQAAIESLQHLQKTGTIEKLLEIHSAMEKVD